MSAALKSSQGNEKTKINQNDVIKKKTLGTPKTSPFKKGNLSSTHLKLGAQKRLFTESNNKKKSSNIHKADTILPNNLKGNTTVVTKIHHENCIGTPIISGTFLNN
jgi:hypothetical protein